MADVEENAVASSLSCLLSELLLSWLNHSQHTYTQHTLQPQPPHMIRKRWKAKRGRETCFHLQDKWFLLDNLMMLIWENPHSSPHTHICTHSHARAHAHAHTHTNTHIHSHVNICGDSSRRQRSKSEPHLLLDLPHTHARIQLFYPGSKPNLA